MDRLHRIQEAYVLLLKLSAAEKLINKIQLMKQNKKNCSKVLKVFISIPSNAYFLHYLTQQTTAIKYKETFNLSTTCAFTRLHFKTSYCFFARVQKCENNECEEYKLLMNISPLK